MANTFTKRTIIDGPKTTVIHAFLASDGASGEISDGVLVDVSTLSPAPLYVAIEKILWNLTGFAATLEFDATTDQGVKQLPQDIDGCQTYNDIGGLTDPKASGFTGDILLTTQGFTAATDIGDITIYITKHF